MCAADIRDMVASRRERSSRSRSPPLATAREGEYAQGRSSPISLVCVGQLLDTRCVRGRSRFCPRVSGRRHASAHSARWCGAHREGPWRLGRRLPPGSRSGDRAARRFRPPQLPREEMHAAPPPPSQRAHGACRAHCPGSACRRVHEPCVCLKNVKTATSASRHPGTTSDHTRVYTAYSTTRDRSVLARRGACADASSSGAARVVVLCKPLSSLDRSPPTRVSAAGCPPTSLWWSWPHHEWGLQAPSRIRAAPRCAHRQSPPRRPRL